MPQLASPPLAPLDRLSWPTELVAAITAAPLCGLGEGPQSPQLAQWITTHPQLALSTPASDPAMADACRAGLWLLAGDLDRSHTLSQNIGSAEGSFWHGVMHRREGDFGNAKYWFRQVGDHPVLHTIAAAADQPLRSASGCFDAQRLDPLAFIDACQQAIGRGGEAAERCQRIQWLEWQALFAHGMEAAWAPAP